MPGLLERSRRPRNSPTRLSAEVEAEICELRRRHPRCGARQISHELSGRGLESAPSRATVHRVLSRNGLVRAQEQQHPRTYRRRQREAPMHLRQMDPAGRRQPSGSSAAADDTAENSSDIPRSVRHSAHTAVSAEHANQNASRTQRPNHPAPPAVLENLRKAGAAKAEGAPPLSQAQVDQMRRHPAPGRLSGHYTSWSATPDGWGAVGAVLGTGGTGCGHAPLAFALTQCRSASPLVWSSLIASETDHWTGMAPAMLVSALGFGTGVIARTRPQSMDHDNR